MDSFTFDGDAIENNWRKHKDGDIYRQRMGKAGRPDIQEWAERELQTAVDGINRDFSKRYKWGAATRADIKQRAVKPAEEVAKLSHIQTTRKFGAEVVEALSDMANTYEKTPLEMKYPITEENVYIPIPPKNQLVINYLTQARLMRNISSTLLLELKPKEK